MKKTASGFFTELVNQGHSVGPDASPSAATLAQFVDAAKRYAANGAKAAFVFDAARSAELLGCLGAHSLEPKRIRFVHPRANAPATTILVEARKGGGIEALVEPPLMLYDRPGVYSDEARE